MSVVESLYNACNISRKSPLMPICFNLCHKRIPSIVLLIGITWSCSVTFNRQLAIGHHEDSPPLYAISTSLTVVCRRAGEIRNTVVEVAIKSLFEACLQTEQFVMSRIDFGRELNMQIALHR